MKVLTSKQLLAMLIAEGIKKLDGERSIEEKY